MMRVTNDVLISQRVPGTARQDMHSTVVCCDRLHRPPRTLAHAGDSRMYWFRDGRVLDRRATTVWCSRSSIQGC